MLHIPVRHFEKKSINQILSLMTKAGELYKIHLFNPIIYHIRLLTHNYCVEPIEVEYLVVSRSVCLSVSKIRKQYKCYYITVHTHDIPPNDE